MGGRQSTCGVVEESCVPIETRAVAGEEPVVTVCSCLAWLRTLLPFFLLRRNAFIGGLDCVPIRFAVLRLRTVVHLPLPVTTSYTLLRRRRFFSVGTAAAQHCHTVPGCSENALCGPAADSSLRTGGLPRRLPWPLGLGSRSRVVALLSESRPRTTGYHRYLPPSAVGHLGDLIYSDPSATGDLCEGSPLCVKH